MDLNQRIILDQNKQDGKEEKKQIVQLLRGKRFADIFYESNFAEQPTWKRKEAHTNEKNWEKYQAELNKELKRKLSKNIEKGTANKLLQKKKTSVVEEISYTDAENKKLRKDIWILGKWYRKLKKNKEREITVQEVEELNRFIEPLKNCWGLEIVEVVKQDYST
ncbi:17334_t:CDS:2, partial [Gigaspora margarita]